MAISFPKETQQFAVLPAGEYGINEPAELVMCSDTKPDGTPYAFYGDDARPALLLAVLVRSEEHGFIRVMESLELPTSPDAKIGNKASKWFGQLGVSAADIENGFEPEDLVGSSVIITVTNRTDKNGTPRNNITNIMLSGTPA